MDTANFSQQLHRLPTLVKTLAEDHTHKFKISPDGHLSVRRGARWTSSKTPLDVAGVRALAEEVVARGEQAVLGPWFLRVLPGFKGRTVFGERRLALPDGPIPQKVHEELLHLARHGSTGVIAGGVGSRKGSLLLWLASQLGRRELVIVSDVPPRELPAPTATHVFPPTNGRQRRDLERLLRAHDCIFWDHISHADDMLTLVNTPNTHNRWFSVDADTPEALALRLGTLIRPLGNLHLDCAVFIDVAAAGEADIVSLARHRADGWSEVLGKTTPVADMLASLDDLVTLARPPKTPDEPAHAEPVQPKPTRAPEAQPAAPAQAASEPDVEADGQPDLPPAASPSPTSEAAIITPKRAGKSGPHRAARPTIAQSQDDPTVTSDIRPLSDSDLDDETAERKAPDTDQAAVEHDAAAKIQGMSVDELLTGDDIDEEELLRQSGEIDLKAFVRARNARKRQQQAKAEASPPAARPDFDQPPPSIGLEQSSDDAVTNIADGAKVDAMLAEMGLGPAADGPPSFPGIDPDELTPPVRGETTALTAVDMERIRESARDDLEWLLDEDVVEDNETPTNHSLASEATDQGTEPATPIWDLDPAPTNELSAEDVRRERRAVHDSEAE